MDAELSASVGFAASGAAALVATPLAITVARRTDFLDRPRGYRRHAVATPFLGGSAVLFGFLAATTLIGGFSGGSAALLVGAIAMWLLGTCDDRFAVAPKWRLLAESLAAVALIIAGLGWRTNAGGGVDLVLTILWIVGIVNAFNLMDNMDGACSTVGCVSALGIGVLAADHRQSLVAGMAFALAGACLAFLRWNLARPARIFLGDGGSMLIGFLVAALGIVTARHLRLGDANLLVISLMVAVTMLDSALVSVSRLRRGVSLVTGGRDHLTYRLLRVLASPRSVAAALAAVQGILCALAVASDDFGSSWVTVLAAISSSLAVLLIVLLDGPRWRPAGIAVRRGNIVESDFIHPAASWGTTGNGSARRPDPRHPDQNAGDSRRAGGSAVERA